MEVLLQIHQNLQCFFKKIQIELPFWWNYNFIFFFKASNFRNRFQNVYVVKLIYGRVAVCTMWACNFTKRNFKGTLGTVLHWVVLNMKHLLEKELEIWKLFYGDKTIHFFLSLSEYVITKKLLSLLYFHHS